jgi:hypothetical protein
VTGTSSTVGRVSQLDKATLMKLQAGCNFINAEVEKARRRVIMVSVICAILGLGGYSYLWNRGQTDPRFPLGAAATVAILHGVNERRKLTKTYKGIVVRRVVAALGHGLTYSPESKLTKQDFLDMDLFEKRAERLEAEDEICGRKNVVTYSLQEAKATRTEGSGKRRRTVVIFRGLVVRLDFNKHFKGHTVVVPDRESKILGGLFGESESRRRKDIVRLENIDFERLFSVYSSDQQEARYLLTPKLMELVLRAQSTLGGEFRLSFHDNSVFLTIPENEDRFDIGLFSPKITPEVAAGDLAEVVFLAEQLIDTLELETRIWTRV